MFPYKVKFDPNSCKSILSTFFFFFLNSANNGTKLLWEIFSQMIMLQDNQWDTNVKIYTKITLLQLISVQYPPHSTQR